MDRIGRYRIAGEVGRGAMGVVYRASDPAIGRDVAIKTIRLDGERDGREKLRERLFREARSAGVLSHPNIVTIYDMGEAEVDDAGLVAYVAMGLVRGPSLEALIAVPEPLPGARIFSILRQTAMALDYAHARGVVHRDIKPGNIMTDEDGSVKITDFGIARFVAAEHLNQTKTITGTPNYMSPEQVQGLDIDGRTDQFSLGVVAWEILTGERPFPGDNLSSVIYRIVSEEPLPAHHLNGALTPRIDETLRRVLSKNPGARFANCASFVGALEMACAESPGWSAAVGGASASMPTVAQNWQRPVVAVPLVPIEPPPFPPPSVKPSRERQGWMWLAIVCLVAAAGLGAVMFWPADEVTTIPAASIARKVSPAQMPVRSAGVVVPQPIPVTPPEVKAEEPVPDPDPPKVEAPKIREPRVPVASAPTPKGKLQDVWITTNPPSAKAVIDGNSGLSCTTPCVLYARPGRHEIMLSLNGFRHERKEIHVLDQPLDLAEINLQQIMSSLLVSSVPPGAAIMLNGSRLAQTTPASLPLKPGSYTVTVSKDGVTRTEKVQLGESPHLLRIPLNY